MIILFGAFAVGDLVYNNNEAAVAGFRSLFSLFTHRSIWAYKSGFQRTVGVDLLICDWAFPLLLLLQ